MLYSSLDVPLLYTVNMVRVVNKILSCWVNKTNRRGIKHLVFPLVLYFFYFPLKVARGHFHNSLGNSWLPPLNDSPDGYRTEWSQIWSLISSTFSHRYTFCPINYVVKVEIISTTVYNSQQDWRILF